MATLHLICGMAGAGKTTLARQLAAGTGAIRFSPDEWIRTLASDEQNRNELDRLRNPVEALQWAVAQDLLKRGLDVILENGFWSPEEREQYRRTAQALGAEVVLHYLNVSRDVLWQRISSRNGEPGAFFITEQELDTWLSWFIPPTPEEGMGYERFLEYS